MNMYMELGYRFLLLSLPALCQRIRLALPLFQRLQVQVRLLVQVRAAGDPRVVNVDAPHLVVAAFAGGVEEGELGIGGGMHLAAPRVLERAIGVEGTMGGP